MSCTLYLGGKPNWVECPTDSATVLLTGEIGTYTGVTIRTVPEEVMRKWRTEEEINRLMRSKRPADRLRLQCLQRDMKKGR